MGCINRQLHPDCGQPQRNEWMVSGEKSLTPKGNVRSTSQIIVVEWVKNPWDSISPTIIVRSFKKCGISNKLDGSEDDMLWEQADWDELFGEDSSVESDFEGFQSAKLKICT